MKQIEKSAVPGLDRMIGMVKRVEVRNRVVIAFVIALCFAILIYFHVMRPLLIVGEKSNEVIV